MVIGLALSVVVFLWALKNGQFKDQQRARFIPLENDRAAQPKAASRFVRLQTVALFSLVCLCLAASAAVIVFALWKATP